MKNLRTRIFCFVLTLVLLVSTLPLAVFAEEIKDIIPDAPADNEEGENSPNPDDEQEIDLSTAVDVATAEELAAQLSAGTAIIRIVSDIEVDRSFYITSDVIIFTDEARTLTRATDFGGDIFVVGESENGERTEGITLTLGNPLSTDMNMLTLDGNADGMAVDVVGSVIFASEKTRVDLYHGLTVKNANKVGNERVLAHTVSYASRVGGAVAILANKATMNIYGGSYINNRANDITDSSTEEGMLSSYGGAFYNYGVLTVYGGAFEGNHAARGGVFYNYRTLNLHRATIKNNTASTLGGAIYVPSSTVAYTYIGEDNDVVEPEVLFEGNSATGAGAVYMCNVGSIKNTTFRANTATTSYGGAIQARSTVLKIENCKFTDNISVASHGGSIYITGSNGEDEREVDIMNTQFTSGEAKKYGGAMYVSGDARVYVRGGSMQSISAARGGAVYATGSSVDLNGVKVADCSSDEFGGAIVSYSGATVKLNKVTASKNTATTSGGFLYAESAHAEVYNSTIFENSAGVHGGAVCIWHGATGNIYATTFISNTASSNGGALATYPNEALNSLVHSCTFEGNTAANYGGAIWSSGKSQISLYNITATNNDAAYGGFFYFTTAGSIANIVGLVLSGNTDDNGGPIIWGNTYNAKLYIDKLKYIDNDYDGDWNDEYWTSAIANKVTVYDITGEIPAYEDYGTGELIQPAPPVTATDVSTAAQLERALDIGYSSIRITASFELDRTFYVKANTMIFSTKSIRLTRAANFGGDVFVVGRDADGNAYKDVTLVLGKADSELADMFIIDGNREHMTVDVVGTVIYVCSGATAELYHNLTVINCKKVGNGRVTSKEVSYPENTGGAVSIVTKGAFLNIYGGLYANNAVNNVDDLDSVSSYGGAFYNYGVLIVCGGVFEGNHAGRGGAFYNYRTLYIRNATISGNSASTYGGAIYVPNSTSAFTYIGEDPSGREGNVIFRLNNAYGAGAIYARHHMSVRNATFESNAAEESGGAIMAGNIELRIANSSFHSNSALKYGGAIYLTEPMDAENAHDIYVRSTVFTSNESSSYGGALYMSAGVRGYLFSVNFITNSASRGAAIYLTNSKIEINGSEMTGNVTTGVGGAMAIYTDSYALANNITATGNESGSTGGFAYVQASVFDLYNSTVKTNSANTHGGGLAVYHGTSGNEYTTLANVYATKFIQNTAGSNGGAVAIYPRNSSCTLMHSCTFEGNTAADYGGGIWISGPGHMKLYNAVAEGNHAANGGFLYVTTSGTVATVVGLTVSKNTDDNGGPIIWGNTTNAELHIDKSKYTDLDYTGAHDAAYWKKAIYNKLSVSEISETIDKYLDYGNEPYDHMGDAVDVSTVEELERAILSGEKHIRIIADIEIDRTLFITGDVTIFSTMCRTIVRAPGFTGDMFVVGESGSGVSSLLTGGQAKLTLGNPLSEAKDLLIIDGNEENMTADVVGSVLFICNSATVNLYDNVTMVHHKKLGNERATLEKHLLSNSNRVGGALAIIASGTLNIYGGDYSYNSTRFDEVVDASDPLETGRASTNGGAFFNYSNLNIYGGTFIGNRAARGGLIYNYRVVKILGGAFIENETSGMGGVYYAPNSSQVQLYVGSQKGDNGEIVFRENSAGGHGGVISLSTLAAAVIYGNVKFIDNHSEGSGGAISAYGSLTVRNSEFIGNTARSRGGAIYNSKSSADSITRHTEITDCLFDSNAATYGGAVALYASSLDYSEGAIARISGSTFIANKASLESSGASAAYGGAIHADRQIKLWISSSDFEGNAAATEGGAIYAASMSVVSIENSTMSQNTSGKHGGAIVLRSSDMIIERTNLIANTAVNNGGAIYVSYQSNIDKNATLCVKGCTFSANESEGNGGAIYFTRRDIEEQASHLNIKDTDFLSNKAANGGAIFAVTGVVIYMKDVSFEENAADKTESGDGGALQAAGSLLEIDGASFTQNTATALGGAISATAGAKLVLNSIVASKNVSGTSGGFAFVDGASLELYNSEIKNNEAGVNAGGIYFDTDASANVYNTSFTENVAKNNGSAIMIYNGGKTVLLHTVRLEANSAEGYGTVYVSNRSDVKIYNVTATGNTAKRGGFLYATTSGTAVTLKGITVGANDALEGGSIIWGNSSGTTLYIDKDSYTDLDHIGALDSDYWSEAIFNELTVQETSLALPAYEDYEPRIEETVAPPDQSEISVDEIFNLAEGTVSNAAINSYYDKLPILDNSSNFMSSGVSTFENINGETVTVDNFIYQYQSAEGNGTVGEGLLIYQAMLYKRANPDVDVSISLSAYRVSVQAAVNINRSSRYFGYMRNLSGCEYDAYGFVRVAYLLVCAAKMGINVTVIGQLDGYPATAGERNLDEYFTGYLSAPCDSSYANGTVGDYMNYKFCYWTLHEKGGTDMMHTKMCAVSHYLDMNGVAHKNAVFSSSSNLDGITNKGYNGNYNLQTSTIISDHEAIYRVTKNYLALISEYCAQEAVYEWQDIMRIRNKEQMDLILAGRGDEIPKDEQLVYLGSEEDNVFELYFTPFADSVAVWDTVYQPYAKYITEMYNSEGPIIFIYNVAEHSNKFAFGAQLDSIIVNAFHNNKSPENKFYVNMASFDASWMRDLVIGDDIGTLSVNNMEFRGIHNKDVLVSYVKDGQRYYVSLLNSCNFHSGSMSYQSNFMLVIKETELREDGVFFTMADNTTKGVVSHTYGEEKIFIPEDITVDGYSYRQCLYCEKTMVVGVVHRHSDWITDREASVGTNGLKHKECTACGTTLEVRETVLANEALIGSFESINGTDFDVNPSSRIETGVSGSILTLEAMLQLSPSAQGRGGVIVGNYSYDGDGLMNLEVYDGGRIRLYFRVNGIGYSYVFCEDIRGEAAVHITVTLDGNKASLYINGALSESLTLNCAIPEDMTEFFVGGDNRSGNDQYFKGRIYSVALFSDVRTEREIMQDMITIYQNTEGLLYAKGYTSIVSDIEHIDCGGVNFEKADPAKLGELSETPHTIEAIIRLSEKAGGVIVGANGMRLAVTENGGVALYYTVDGVEHSVMFDAHIRAFVPVHIAITVNSLAVYLYIDGRLSATATLDCALPALSEEFFVGAGGADAKERFSGTIYAVALFADARDAAEIAIDSLLMPDEGEGLLYSVYLSTQASRQEGAQGESFTADTALPAPNLSNAPHTFEAVIRVSKDFNERVGVIVGNYDGGTGMQVNIEIYDGGRPRLYIKNGNSTVWCVFDVDIRSDKAVHIAITVEGKTARLYVDGIECAAYQIACTVPENISNLLVGGDNRALNSQYFKGEIYSVRIFSDVRTADEIAKAARGISGRLDGLMYSRTLATYTKESSDDYRPSAIIPESTEPVIAYDAYGRPLTIEALVSLDKRLEGRGGIIIGNYTAGAEDQINLEVYTEGRVRLFYIKNGLRMDCIFSADIRLGVPVHIAVTVDGLIAKLYINGAHVEDKELSLELPEIDRSLIVGADYRYVYLKDHAVTFKGSIYFVNIFSDVRSAEEIAADARFVPADTEGLSYSLAYGERICDASTSERGHLESDWIIDREATDDAYGLMHTECTRCGKVLAVKEIPNVLSVTNKVVYNPDDAMHFESAREAVSAGPLSAAPKTYEFVIGLSKDYFSRAGVIFGNYKGTDDIGINVEIYTNGAPRFYYKVGGIGYSVYFSADVRSSGIVHMAITIDGLEAKLYLDGALVEVATMEVAVPETAEGFMLGSDLREGSEHYFKGEIYAVNIFSDVRTAEEIKYDAIKVAADADNLLYSYYCNLTVEPIE